jgi:hypothetical protein
LLESEVFSDCNAKAGAGQLLGQYSPERHSGPAPQLAAGIIIIGQTPIAGIMQTFTLSLDMEF